MRSWSGAFVADLAKRPAPATWPCGSFKRQFGLSPLVRTPPVGHCRRSMVEDIADREPLTPVTASICASSSIRKHRPRPTAALRLVHAFCRPTWRLPTIAVMPWLNGSRCVWAWRARIGAFVSRQRFPRNVAKWWCGFNAERTLVLAVAIACNVQCVAIICGLTATKHNAGSLGRSTFKLHARLFQQSEGSDR